MQYYSDFHHPHQEHHPHPRGHHQQGGMMPSPGSVPLLRSSASPSSRRPPPPLPPQTRLAPPPATILIPAGAMRGYDAAEAQESEKKFDARKVGLLPHPDQNFVRICGASDLCDWLGFSSQVLRLCIYKHSPVALKGV